MKNFNPKDLQQIESHGLSHEKVLQNLKTFREGIPFVELSAPATLENGIRKLSGRELEFYAEKYENTAVDVVKFIPASGAATRMFKDLLAFRKAFKNRVDLASNGKNLEELIRKPEHKPVRNFFENLQDFPFYETLLSETKKAVSNFEHLSKGEKNYLLLEILLDENAMNFPNLPKGLVPFHQYPQEIRTAFEEHFREAATYSTKNKKGNLHFTVTEKHVKKFRDALKNIRKKTTEENEVEYDVSFSFQEKNTDTMAANLQNEAFRDENDKLVFRPSGHGALLENLNQIHADLIFIKNIDNVSTENNLSLIASHKKALAGILLELQTKIFGFLKMLENPSVSEKIREEIAAFLKTELNVHHEPKTISEIKKFLDRPIRVCGMVKNTGAPGGGPFWMKNDENSTESSLQIVETAQIDLNDPQQQKILEKATHFNPVDLVCGVKDHKGKKFDLTDFSNPKRGFISQKSMNGHDLKALELPGLWNGSMENWNTVFVEVPLETFNPVKTVMDLLKPGHREVSSSKFQLQNEL